VRNADGGRSPDSRRIVYTYDQDSSDTYDLVEKQ
jgi:hypothetical protein